ncbi:MAG: patatin-like phospholipase family protein [Alphaproteobacteria bacterium]
MNYHATPDQALRAPPKSHAPIIGVALGGGVARGWTHIGVIKGLLDLGIVPDIICGTSVGALVGGCYLAGHLETLETWARSLNKRRMLSYLDLFSGGSGLMGGKRLQKEMEKSLGGKKVEDLDRKFVAVCAELATGHEIWLQNGDLITAIRASYALPGAFPPVKIDGRWLIDGALVDPVPVSVCRAMGARLVLGVTLNGDTFGKSNRAASVDLGTADTDSADASFAQSPQRVLMRQLFGTDDSTPGVGTVMLGALNIIMDRLSRSRMAGDPPDVLISPRIGHIGLLDFDKADEMIRLGREAVLNATPMLDEALAILR